MSDEDSDTVCKGTVKWFDTIKGYGFIQPDDGSSDGKCALCRDIRYVDMLSTDTCSPVQKCLFIRPASRQKGFGLLLTAKTSNTALSLTPRDAVRLSKSLDQTAKMFKVHPFVPERTTMPTKASGD